MALDNFEYLPGIINELQDGGLQISEASSAPAVLVLGTASQGISGRKSQVVRAQESENQFQKEGTLVSGMYEAIAGGSTNTFLMRINTKSAIIYGVGTDDQVTSPTSIETLVKDGSAADLYFIRYESPATLGPNAVVGRLRVQNALGRLVYDSNPGGQIVDLGEVIVSGTFDGSDDIGNPLDATDYVSMREIAQDRVAVLSEDTGVTYIPAAAEITEFDTPVETALAGKYFEFSSPTTDYYGWYTLDAAGADPAIPGKTGVQIDLLTGDGDTGVATKTAAAINGLADFSAGAVGTKVTVTNATVGDAADLVDGDAGITNIVVLTQGADSLSFVAPLANDNLLGGSLVVYVNGNELASSAYTHDTVASPDEVTVLAGLANGGLITVDYIYDADSDYNLRDGSDGVNPSKMELYEALDEAYASLESDEIDIVVPRGVYLDDKNIADGDTIVLASDESLPVGGRYPIAGTSGDGLGLVHKEEYEGEVFYFWDIDDDGQAEIWPDVGAASATTKIDGSALTSTDFHEVNFAYQLANFCFSLSVNDNEAQGVIGVKAPASYAAKDIARWVGKAPTVDAEGLITEDGTGLLGNKFHAGTLSRENGYFATYSGYLPTSSNFDSDADIITDRNGHKIDIGKYISTPAMYLTFFNSTDETGFGYVANMAAFYAGFYSSLASNSAPTNKVVSGVRAPFRLSKTKLNSLAKYKFIAIKQKENELRISDSPTAARDDSDFTRLTTVRVIADVVDTVRSVARPYIGEPNTPLARVSLETGITRELSKLQELGFIQRFEVRVSATTTQVIQGDATVELTIVPPFELRKITVITSLARQ